MSFALTEEQTMLADSAKRFLQENSPIMELRKLRDDRNPDGFSRKLWAQFAEMGWTGILVPEVFGGIDVGHVGAGLICEEIGRALAASPFVMTSMIAATGIRTAGSPAQQEQWLPAISSGKALLTLAVDEGRKHDPGRTALRAERSCSGFTIRGAKSFVLDAHVADIIIVAARTSGTPDQEQGLTLFFVDRKAGDLSVEQSVLVDSRYASRVIFDDVAVDRADILGQVDDGARVLRSMLDVGRAGFAAELGGIAQESFERTCSYLGERRQFDKLIGSNQALQHRAAQLYCGIQLSRAAILKALQSLDESPAEAASYVSLAKAKAGEICRLATAEAVQMHGGIGMTDQFDIGLFMKRGRVAAELLGDSDFHADRFAKLRGY